MGVYIAFYRDKGFGAKLIQWWTHSKYNHCEVWNGTELIGVPSNAKQIRRQEQLYLNPKKWTVYKIKDINFNKSLEEYYTMTKGSKYDNKAIWLSNIFNRREQDKNRFTCSEWLISLLDYHYKFIYPKWFSSFSPQDILEVIEDKGIAEKVELK